ncbi:carbohydrate binding family 6 [Leadbetterella byssophila DSM 17132]|uniref:Carbohydrate binding family 6 n=1 Tax=Leadbetterella byssophila (strain DSM 17132 / JCM 16389 / KACC 11308 / NBRC 106382 / 4M15) TaxID=649349 RepID=E4RW13_LEAB4|nr:sugar-binding protein [Leadbetterella byssophila]ADQ16156.1 carbohydrate binding family 6 [Leadbetterella byssophila DSM 17132]
MIKYCWVLVFLCACSKSAPVPDLPEPPPVPTYQWVGQERVFGFYNQYRYSYCPSVVKDGSGFTHMFFCGNPEQTIMVDNIYHVKWQEGQALTEAKSVLQPGVLGSWDDHHTCDPSVVQGDFSMGGERYTYAMFYLTNPYSAYYNEVGVAFSNSLDGDSWVKYPKQIVSKPWTYEGDELLPNGGKSWGVGQPSAFTLDKKGKVILTYTVGDIQGTRIEWAELDLSDMDKFQKRNGNRMVQNGLVNIGYTGQDYTCNSDFAVDIEKNKIVMVRPVQPHPSTYPAFLNESLEVNYMDLSDFMAGSGKWEVMLRISPYMTGFARNHNAGLERNGFGEISKWEEPTVYFTVSKAAPEVSAGTTTHAEWTYHIYRGKIVKQ